MSTFSLEPVTKENSNEVTAFLAGGEKTCVSLLSHFVSHTSFVLPPASHCCRAVYQTEKDKKLLFAVVCITSGGLLLHHFPYLAAQSAASQADADCGAHKAGRAAAEPPAPAEKNGWHEKITQLKELFSSFLKDIPLFCIMGESSSSELLVQWYGKTPRCSRAYTLMEYLPQQALSASELAPLPPGFMLRRCTEEDAESLYPLQKEYEYEEVLPPGEPFSAFSCRAGLRHNLQVQYVYALFYDATPVAKAGSNAQGIRYEQLGGVFTVPEWRNKGFATLLVRYAAEKAAMRGKKTVLFVKNENEPAKHAYRRAGFFNIAGYAIIYF